MTPEKMTDALGPEWKEEEDERESELPAWRHGAWEVADCPFEGWVVRARRGPVGLPPGWACPTPEAAVAVAHLLVAAERVAAGAEVLDVADPKVLADKGWVTIPGRHLTPPSARRLAIDLLGAADAAEATR